MGIFTRFRDIISSNLNAMLDRAEDPEKMIKLIIREMEDTLVEIKAACAGAMAGSKKVHRQMEAAESRVRYWEQKAAVAVKRARDDLARQALIEKRRYKRRFDALNHELTEHNLLFVQYQEDIRQLEAKLKSAHDKERMLVQRHIHADTKKRAAEEMRRTDSVAAMMKFEEFETRIERMEVESDLVNFGRKTSLEEELETLTADEEIEQELQALKSPVPLNDEPRSTATP
ncbi:MAG: PspA/IM30 family protein [Desulfobacterales bacterium]|nr:MAG: PspA/IM30 family protein [Desulfobacterales bacterium]